MPVEAEVSLKRTTKILALSPETKIPHGGKWKGEPGDAISRVLHRTLW